MTDTRPVPYDLTLAQIHGLRSELQTSQQKILVELFVSSFAVFMFIWICFSLVGKLPGTFAMSLIFPTFICAAMWATWIVLSRFPRQMYQFDMAERHTSGEDLRELYNEYEWLRFSLRRQRRIERLLDALTAMLFIVMALVLSYVLLQLSRY
jgi:hypothetical protein